MCTCAGRCAFSAHTTPDHKSYRFNKEGAEHKDLCDTELTTNTQTRKEKTATVEKFHDTVDELDASMENLAMEVAKETPGVSSSRSSRRTPIRGQTVP